MTAMNARVTPHELDAIANRIDQIHSMPDRWPLPRAMRNRTTDALERLAGLDTPRLLAEVRELTRERDEAVRLADVRDKRIDELERDSERTGEEIRELIGVLERLRSVPEIGGGRG